MRRLAALALSLCLAGPAPAQTPLDGALNMLLSDGYTITETGLTWLGRYRIVARRGDILREIVVSRATGEIKQDALFEEPPARPGRARDDAAVASRDAGGPGRSAASSGKGGGSAGGSKPDGKQSGAPAGGPDRGNGHGSGHGDDHGADKGSGKDKGKDRDRSAERTDGGRANGR